MSASRKICLGLDLTQHRPMMALAEGEKITEYNILANTPPAALLPIVDGESVMAGAAAHNHRRGTGSVWPPECQAPVYGEYLNGVGRIPLVCAWAKLAKRVGEGFSGSIGNTDISWRPTGEGYISFPSERLITESVIAWKKEYDTKKTAIVVPDTMDEAAQQALIDNFDAFLTPRPVAVALSWCRRNAENYQSEGEKSEEGAPIGHLLVITMALDQWEVVPIEIRARKFDKRVWLVPVRNRVYEVDRIPRFGVGLFMGISVPTCNNAGEIWQFAFGSEKASSFADGRIVLNGEQIDALRQYIPSGWTERDRNLFSSWDIWADIFAASSRMSIDGLKEGMATSYMQQLRYLDHAAAEKCLGVIIDGACSCVRISENRQFGNIIAKAFESHPIEITDGFEAVRGAAYTSAALEKGLPCYRETIIPIEFHHHSRDEKGDLKNAWKMLVEGRTIEAGTGYKSGVPVEGLKIKKGAKILTLTLRRPADIDKYIYRAVKAEIPEETRQDEPVKMTVNLMPGQGFAKVSIDSIRDGVFRTLLNWKSMKPCDPPPPPPLAYLPEVSRIVHDSDKWFGAETPLQNVIKSLRSDSPDSLKRLGELRKHMNKWPLADSVDEYRGRPLKGDIFLHYGVFSSNGNLEEVESPALAKEFVLECTTRFSGTLISKEKNAIQQTASWLYLACPSIILESVRKKLRLGIEAISPVDLHTMGLCFENPADIKLFFSVLEKRFQQDATNNNNWLRATRNIVRFREHALKPEIVKRSRLTNIFRSMIKSLENEVGKQNFHMIFDNCVLSSLYLLKRRRYEPNFLSSDSELYRRLDDILSNLLEKRKMKLTDRQVTIVSTTLKFLHKEGRYEDLTGIMMEK